MATEKPCVLVTGAGGGLGSAIAAHFHDKGYHVIATDYSIEPLAGLEGQPDYTIARLDVTSVENAREVAERIRTELGRLDVIINNAGVDVFAPITEAPPEKTMHGFMINTFAALITTQACLDLLIESKGTVVNISSESAPLRTPFQFYQSSKLALEALSETMRRELMCFGAHVAVIRPGAIETPFIAGHGNITNPVENSRYSEVFQRFAEGVPKASPKKKSKPEDVAALVFHAATDPARKLMYGMNHSLMLKVLQRLPARLLDKLILKQLTA